MNTWDGDDHGTFPIVLPGDRTYMCCVGQRDPSAAILLVPFLDRSMAIDCANGGIETREQALALADGISVKQATLPLITALSPPLIDRLENAFW